MSLMMGAGWELGQPRYGSERESQKLGGHTAASPWVSWGRASLRGAQHSAGFKQGWLSDHGVPDPPG